jgi:xylulokinase
MDVLQAKDFNAEQANTEQYLGKNDVFFLPYLMGERSPHNDVNAKGAFIGLRPTTTRAQLTLAVMEGVAFALRDCIEIARQNGLAVEKSKICGGGAKSPLWRKVIADVCGVTLEIPSVEEGPSYGGALLAMVGSGAYQDVTSAVNATVRTVETIEPNREIALLYDQKYEVFKKFYPALKEIYKTF